MQPSRAEGAGYRLACVAGILLSIAVLVQPTIALAADDNAIVNAASPVVLRGTRPITPTPAQSPKAASEPNQTPVPYMGFLPRPLTGSGWNTEYSTDGLSYTPGVTQ